MPEFYLRRFANSKDQVATLDLEDEIAFPQSVGDATVEVDYNTVDVGGQPSDAAEQTLSEMESVIAPAFQWLDDDSREIDSTIATGLVNFFALQYFRGDVLRQDLRIPGETAGTDAPRRYTGPVVTEGPDWASALRFSRLEYYKWQAGYQGGEPPMSLRLMHMLDLASGLVFLFSRASIQLVRFDSHDVVTSDHPAHLHVELHGNEVLRLEGTLPLDRQTYLALLLPSSPKGNIRRHGSQRTMEAWNRAQFREASRFLFGHPDTLQFPQGPLSRGDINWEKFRRTAPQS